MAQTKAILSYGPRRHNSQPAEQLLTQVHAYNPVVYYRPLQQPTFALIPVLFPGKVRPTGGLR